MLETIILYTDFCLLALLYTISFAIMLESNHFRKQTINCCYYTQVSFAIMLETTIFRKQTIN